MGIKERDFPSLFLKTLGKPLERFVLLSHHSSFKIGGEADYFFEATSPQELANAVMLARECSLPFYVIGEGCNLLFDDQGFHGLVVKNAVKGIRREKETEAIEVLSGTLLKDMVRFCLEEGLGGFEFLAGIPGTVGGAVFGNAGAFGKSIGDYLKEAFLLNVKGEEVRVKKDYFSFNYRHSYLKQKHDLLLKSLFVLSRGERAKIEEKIEKNLEKRRKRHPPGETAYAGSYFKNPVLPDGKKVTAGHLLEQVGAKGMRVGDAVVHHIHANFVINLGKASARDVLSLALELKRRVKEKFSIALEEEVTFLPADSSMR